MNWINLLFKKFQKRKFVCPGGFSQVYLYPDGRVYLCPDCFVDPNEAMIGNLNENSFEKIYNSKKAIKLRKNFLKGKYISCSPVACFKASNYNYRLIPTKGLEYKKVQKQFPKMVCIGSDCECNVNCIMCRPTLSRLSDQELAAQNEKIEKLYIPILKDAEALTLSTTADPFASRHTRLLMKTAAEKYPNLKFNLLTNGILCDKYNCDEIGITDRLINIMVSIHASNEDTYNKIVKNGNFKKVVENIQWLSSLKKENKIKNLFLAFVISSKNYEDMQNFVEFAKKYNSVALFWPCRDWGGNLKNNEESLEIFRPDHPKFNHFKSILQSMELETEYSHFNPAIAYIRDKMQ